jgi:hypothetical protein
MTREADNGFTEHEWLEWEKKWKKEADAEDTLRESRRNLQPTCPDCGSDNVHVTVTTSQDWDIETGDWCWHWPFRTDAHVICEDCEKEIRPVLAEH